MNNHFSLAPAGGTIGRAQLAGALSHPSSALTGDVPLATGCGAWPRVLILGTQKAATTSIAVALDQQTGLRSPEWDGADCCHRSTWYHCTQETHYFDTYRGCLEPECAINYNALFSSAIAQPGC